jgi:hypothetical protein
MNRPDAIHQRMTFKLKGWKQVLLGLLVIASVPVGYTLLLRRGLETRLPALIEKQLQADLGAEAARKTLPMSKAHETPTRQQAENFAEEFKAVDRLKILRIEKRGWGAKLVVRVTYTTAETTTEHSEQLRYYRLKHNWLGGWFVYRQTT